MKDTTHQERDEINRLERSKRFIRETEAGIEELKQEPEDMHEAWAALVHGLMDDELDEPPTAGTCAVRPRYPRFPGTSRAAVVRDEADVDSRNAARKTEFTIFGELVRLIDSE